MGAGSDDYYNMFKKGNNQDSGEDIVIGLRIPVEQVKTYFWIWVLILVCATISFLSFVPLLFKAPIAGILYTVPATFILLIAYWIQTRYRETYQIIWDLVWSTKEKE